MYNCQEHYDALMTLCNTEGSSFYYVDQMLDSVIYRIFSYRIASYSEFLQPYAREARGHMFRIEDDGNATIVSMPMAKFFNAEENPITIGLDYSDCELVMDKLDGSLISSFLHDGDVRLKSKTSVQSDQAKAAMKLLNTPEYGALREVINLMENNDWTVNMEFTAPYNRIVLPYQNEGLTVLNCRNRITGEYFGYNALHALMEKYKCNDKLVKNYAEEIDDYSAFISTIANMTDCEGYVIKIRNGETVKVKNIWYMTLHKTKDSVNSPRRLYEAIINETHDDLRALFHDDPYSLGLINDMEAKVKDIYIKMDRIVEGFYNANKHLDRKSYAILAQAEVPKLYFGLTMSLYLGKEVDFKEFLIKHWKDFGIKEDEKAAE